jgi:hypothetical protein
MDARATIERREGNFPYWVTFPNSMRFFATLWEAVRWCRCNGFAWTVRV